MKERQPDEGKSPLSAQRCPMKERQPNLEGDAAL